MATTFNDAVGEIHKTLRKVLIAKQKDYGHDNILAFDTLGVLVRAYDKMARLKNLIGNRNAPANESITDSWVDLANYATIALMLERETFTLPLMPEPQPMPDDLTPDEMQFIYRVALDALKEKGPQEYISRFGGRVYWAAVMNWLEAHCAN